MQVVFGTGIYIGAIDIALFAGLPALLAVFAACWDARRGAYRALGGMRPLVWCVLVSYPVFVAVGIARGARSFDDVCLIPLIAPIEFVILGFVPAVLAYTASYAVFSRCGLGRRATHHDPETEDNPASSSQ